MVFPVKLLFVAFLFTVSFSSDYSAGQYFIVNIPGPHPTNPLYQFCPRECECPSYQPFNCVKCKDESRNLINRCQDCNPPKVLVGDQCMVPSCPKSCVCQGALPWVCTGCADIYAEFAEGCRGCKKEAKWDLILNKCAPYTANCPDECICNGTRAGMCTKCVDRFKNLTSNCRDCLESYFVSRAGQCTPYRNFCPELC